MLLPFEITFLQSPGHPFFVRSRRFGTHAPMRFKQALNATRSAGATIAKLCISRAYGAGKSKQFTKSASYR